MPRGVLVDGRGAVARSTTPASSGTGIRKQPVMLFSDMGGIDIEEVAESTPTTSAAATSPTSCRPRDFRPRSHRLGRA
jgi:hypothetical protein